MPAHAVSLAPGAAAATRQVFSAVSLAAEPRGGGPGGPGPPPPNPPPPRGGRGGGGGGGGAGGVK
ncbi:hypothetical protein EJ611_06265, partial [Pseudomonas aeruginosa]